MAYLDDREAFFKLNIIQGSLLWGNICIFKGNNTGQRIINNLKRREKVFNLKIIYYIRKDLTTRRASSIKYQRVTTKISNS